MPFSGDDDQLRRLREAMRSGDPRRPAGLPSLTRFDVQAKIGEGAMSAVYRAVDRQLGRPVALKIFKENALLSDTVRERVTREARAVASLSHPGIVTMHDAGEEGGFVFLVMELVDGMSLREQLQQLRPDPRTAAILMARIARAVHHAHERGVIHRDLKPENILITAGGEPKVGDFGLARIDEESPRLTKPGTILGTPTYMAPEQVRADPGRIDARCDVYALGVILYETLGGRPPFTAGTASELYRQILQDDPPSLRTLNASIPGDLEVVALKAMEKRAGERYPSALEFARDLERFVEGKAIEARPPGAADRLLRRLRRHWRIAVGTALAAAALVAGVALQRLSSEWKARDSRDREAEGRRRAEALIEKAEGALDAAGAPGDPTSRDGAALRARGAEIRGWLETADRAVAGPARVGELLGRCRELEGDVAGARACWEEALKIEPDRGGCRRALRSTWLEECYLALHVDADGRMLEDAIVDRQEFVMARAIPRIIELTRKDDPVDDPFHRKVTEAWMNVLSNTRRETAGPFARSAYERYPGEPRAGIFLWMEGVSSEEGVRAALYGRALELAPASPLILYSRGDLRRRSGDEAGALADFGRAIGFRPSFWCARLARGSLLEGRGRGDEAAADFEAALGTAPAEAGLGESIRRRLAALRAREH